MNLLIPNLSRWCVAAAGGTVEGSPTVNDVEPAHVHSLGSDREFPDDKTGNNQRSTGMHWDCIRGAGPWTYKYYGYDADDDCENG